MRPEMFVLLGWIDPITLIAGIGSFTVFAYYIHISERVSWPIRFTMLGQSVVIAGKTMWDFTAFYLLEPAPFISGAIMFLGGLILLASTFKIHSEVTIEE